MQVDGKRSPRLLPTHTRPTKRQPAMEALITGIWSASSASNALLVDRYVCMVQLRCWLVNLYRVVVVGSDKFVCASMQVHSATHL